MRTGKAVVIWGAVLVGVGVLAACSNALTYIRRDEGHNITCERQQGLKNEGACIIRMQQVKPSK